MLTTLRPWLEPPCAAPPARYWAERILLTAGYTGLFGVAYWGIGLRLVDAPARELWGPVDAAIPFIPVSVFVYAAVYPAACIPAFTVRCPWLFRRVFTAYAVVLAASCLVFVLMPVSAQGLRASLHLVDTAGFVGWGVAKVYELDPPRNLFPSLHVATALSAALAAGLVNRSWGQAALGAAAAIAVSTWTVKQHFMADTAGAVLLSLAVHQLWLRRRPICPTCGDHTAFGRAGPVLLLVLTLGLYAGCFVWFLSDRG